MKQISFRHREEKLRALAQVLGDFLRNSTVLDLGCDTGTLRSYVKSYIGIDISGRPDIIANLEYGIPFRNQSVDIVVAIDVLEHLDKIHDTFDDMCRVARRYVVIGLPNLYESRVLHF